MNTDICILMATYNSENYLEDQIDSIINQTYDNWRLIIRDDLSKDRTINIIKKYVVAYPEKIFLLNNKGLSLGAYMSFYELLVNVDSNYYMFADHDDVWLPEKIEMSMKKMLMLEEKYMGKPIVVHTDMKVVDQSLNIISDSFWDYSKLLPNHVSFEELVLCNSVNGCTMLFNKKAKDVSVNNVRYTTMHDRLIAQSVAANDGLIIPITAPMVLYRQHDDNVVGAHKSDWYYYLKKLFNIVKVIRNNNENWKNANLIRKYPLYRYLMIKFCVYYYKYYRSC